MEDLKQFAAFIAQEHLHEFATHKQKQLMALNAPLLRYFQELSDEEAMERLKKSSLELLQAITAGTLEHLIRKSMNAWEHDLLEGISRTAVSLEDVVLVNAAEKSAFITLLPSFTKNAQTTADIMAGLDEYYTESLRLAAVTVRKIQEEEAQKLQESEDRYKDLFENATDLIHIVRPDGIIMYVNKAWQEALGYTQEELRGTSIYNLVTEKERDRFQAYRERIVAGLPAIETLSTELKAKDGREIIVEGFISCKFRGGKPLYTRGILRNITQRKMAEQQIQFFTGQLVEREENLRQMIRNAPDAIVVIDSKSSIRLWNPMAERMFGWIAMEAVGKDLTDTIIPPVFREAHKRGMAHYLATGEERMMHRTIETTALDKTGTEFYISLTISTSTQAGEPIFIAFIRDISLHKQNAMELERKTEQLERSNRELEQFAWLASHDLKEPLRKIRTFSDLLMHKGNVPESVASYIEKIQHSAQRMNNLIEDLLSYSNVDQAHEQFVETDLNHIVQDVLIDLEIAIKAKKAVIHTGKLPKAEVLPFQMRQLFQNLISNSIKYSRSDTDPLIEITAEDLNDGMAHIRLSDNGIGFKAEYAEKIFQIFQRLVNRDEYEGTGIGLALCKKIIENHQGSIEATSQEGLGTSFTITLPLRHEAAYPAAEPHAHPTSSAPAE